MAAKIAIRSKGGKGEDSGERWVVVNRETLRRVYVGDGVAEEDAKALAETMAEPCFAAPISTIVKGKYVDPDAPVAEEAAEVEGADETADEESAEPVAA